MKSLQNITCLIFLSTIVYGQSFVEQIITDNFPGIQSTMHADFNGDGLKEYVITNGEEDMVSILYWEGSELIEKELISVEGPLFLALGDFDQDNKTDIAIGAGNTDGLRILKNLGDLEFSTQILNTSDFGEISEIVASDIDLDGDLDLIAASTSRTDLALFEMIDPSSFGFNVEIIDEIVVIVDINIADLDNDGFPDIVGSDFFQDELRIFFNQNDNTFVKEVYPVKYSVQNSIADFNNDGLLDIGVTTVIDNNVFVFLNNGDRTFEENPIDVIDRNIVYINAFDINQDDISDIIVGTNQGMVVYLIEDINNNIYVKEEYPHGDWIGDFLIIDIDGDEDMDVVATSISLPGIIHYINQSTVSAIQDLGQASITIYPNPSSNFINIDILGNLNYMVLLYNLKGDLLLKAFNSKQINLNSFSAGYYLIEVKDVTTSQSITEKIFVSK